MALCTCGRQLKYDPHCPMCGSTYSNAKVSEAKKRENGTINRGFRCRKCGATYNEDDPCEAPAVFKVPARGIRQSIVNRLTEGLTDEDKEEILHAAREARKKKDEDLPN